MAEHNYGRYMLCMKAAVSHLQKCGAELVEFNLEFEHTFLLLRDLHLFLLHFFRVRFSFYLCLLPELLYNVEIIVCLLQHELHSSKLLLYTVQVHTNIFFPFLQPLEILLFLAQVASDALFLVRKLLFQHGPDA
jgi:hypothetical protein